MKGKHFANVAEVKKKTTEALSGITQRTNLKTVSNNIIKDRTSVFTLTESVSKEIKSVFVKKN